LLATAADQDLHREQAELADKKKQPRALAFHVGRYLAVQHDHAAVPHEAARLAGWLATATHVRGMLAGLPVAVRTPLHEPAFPDSVACTGILYKDSGIAPERLLTGTAPALQSDPASWLNHALHGGALYRNREYAKALNALTTAVALHGKPSPLTHNLLALTHLALGQKEEASAALTQAAPAKDAPWEDVYLQRLLQAEIDAAVGKAP
jgi:hypothetical protein